MPSKKKVNLTPIGSGRSWPEIRANLGGNHQPVIRQSQIVFTSPYQKTYQVTAQFDKFTKEYFVNEYGARAGLVAVQQGKILLTRQYRLLTDSISWEIPGGGLDERETPEQAAVRECLEETGVRCSNPKPLLFYHPGLDTVFSPTYIFYSTEMAEEHEPGMVNSKEVEGWEWVHLERCIDMIFEQKIMDSFSILALLAYHTQGNNCSPSGNVFTGTKR